MSPWEQFSTEQPEPLPKWPALPGRPLSCCGGERFGGEYLAFDPGVLWVGCIACALEEQDYRAKLLDAGFADVSIDPTRIYNVEDTRHFLSEAGIDVDAMAAEVEGKFASAFIRGTKPNADCCAPRCCGSAAIA
jgi:hypothetical protein